MILNEKGWWRLLISFGVGGGAALGAALLLGLTDTFRRNPGAVLLAGISAGATAYVIDVVTDKKTPDGV